MKTKLALGFTLIALIMIMGFTPLFFNYSHATSLTVTSQTFGTTYSCSGLGCQTASLNVNTNDLIVVSWASFGVMIGSNYYTDYLSISDSQGNTFHLESVSAYAGVNNHGETFIFATNATATSTDTITLASYNGGYAFAYKVVGFTSTPIITSYTAYTYLAGGINPNGISFASYASYASANNCGSAPTFSTGWMTQYDACPNTASSIGIGYANPSVSALIVSNPHDYVALSIVNFANSVSGNCTYFSSVETNTFVTTNSTVISGHTFYFTGTTTNYTTHTSVGYSVSSTTATITETGIIAPNMNSLLYWFFEIVCLFVPVAFIDGWIVESKNVESGTIVFGTLTGLMVGSWIGLIVNVSTWGVAVAFTVIFAIYLWRGRG